MRTVSSLCRPERRLSRAWPSHCLVLGNPGSVTHVLDVYRPPTPYPHLRPHQLCWNLAGQPLL